MREMARCLALIKEGSLRTSRPAWRPAAPPRPAESAEVRRCRESLPLLAFAVFACALAGCELLAEPAPPPRTIPELGVRFWPVAPVPPGTIAPEVAIRSAREAMFRPPDIVHFPPDVVQYGIAECPPRQPECLPAERDTPSVWLVEWSPPGRAEWVVVIVDSLSGHMISAVAGGGLPRKVTPGAISPMAPGI